MDEDRDDVDAVLAGESALFARLVQRHQGPVRGLLRGWLGPSAEIDDLAQDVFLRAWRALRTWRPRRGSFRTWLLAIARNRARDHLRRVGRRPVEVALAAEPEVSAGGDVPPPVALDAALADLSPERRVVFVLADVHQLPLAEIAVIEDVPLGTVKSRLDRARKALREALRGEQDA